MKILKNNVGEAGSGAIFISTSTETWKQRPPNGRNTIIYHEHGHILLQDSFFTQDPTEPLTDVRTNGPAWLVEGAASVFALLVSDRLTDGAESYEQNILHRVESIKEDNRLESLETYEGFLGDPQGSAFSVVATDYLAGGPNLELLASFWEKIGNGLSWQAAFQENFGMPIDTFYHNFDASLDQL